MFPWAIWEQAASVLSHYLNTWCAFPHTQTASSSTQPCHQNQGLNTNTCLLSYSHTTQALWIRPWFFISKIENLIPLEFPFNILAAYLCYKVLSNAHPVKSWYSSWLKKQTNKFTYIQHRELYSMLCGSLDGRRVRRRMHTCTCTTESHCASPETTTTLLICYTPI